MSATTINTFPPIHTFDSHRGWFLALIAFIHFGFFWAFTNGLSFSTAIIKPHQGIIEVIDDPKIEPIPQEPVIDPVEPPTWIPRVPVGPAPNPVIDDGHALTGTSDLPEMPPSSRSGDSAPPQPVVVLPAAAPGGLSEPIYPASSIRAGHTGTVYLSVQVLENGRVGEIRLVQSSGFSKLDEAALREAKKWRFIPGTRDGMPVTLWKDVPITFKLQDRQR